MKKLGLLFWIWSGCSLLLGGQAQLNCPTEPSCQLCQGQRIICSSGGLTTFPNLPPSLQQTVEELILTKNNLTSVRMEDLVNYTSLETLILSSNNISYIEPGSFNETRLLREIDLTSNRLTALPDEIFANTQLITLLLVNNMIESISAATFKGLQDFSTINLNNNHLRTIPIGTFSDFGRIDQLVLTNNPLVCDCHLQWLPGFVDRISSSSSLGTCEVPAQNLTRVAISTLTAEDFECKCDLPCVNGTCNTVIGVCQCDDGFIGTACDTACPAGSYGTDCLQNCTCVPEQESAPCDHIDGTCHCLPGYNGSSCELDCLEGFYGEDCSEECECQNGASCDQLTGQCNCTAGWMREICNETCADGFYGRNCRLMCKCIEKHQDRACNQMNGRCHCLSNYTGLRCELLKTEPMETPTQSANRAAIIAGATVGGALVLLLLIILVVVITVAVIILVVHLRKRKYVRLRVSLSQLFENQTQQSESLVIEPLKFEPLETSSGQDLEESSSSLPGVPLHFRPIGSDHRRESDQYLWKPSTPAYSSASFFVTNKASTIEWKGHGLKIHIPDSSLAPSLVPRSSHAQLKVDVHTLASELGSGCVPVSSLYSVRMGAGKLCKPVTIEFQHCLDVSDAVHISELVILRAADVTKDFEPIDGAVFDRETGCGKVTVPRLNDINQEYDDFSWFVVALRRLFLPSTICYKARVYMYTSKGTTKMYFIVTMALEMCTTVVEKQYPEEIYDLQASFSVEFDTRRKISFNIPEDGKNLESGFVITPFYNPSITKQQVDRFCILHNNIPKCEFFLYRSKGSPSEGQMHRIDLTEGTVNNKKYFLINVDPSTVHHNSIQGDSASPAVMGTPCLHELDLIASKGKTVNVIGKAAYGWEKVATRLYFEGHDISRIQRDKPQAEDACRTMFAEWLEGKGRTPTTWETVIQALNEAKQGELARDLQEVLTKYCAIKSSC